MIAKRKFYILSIKAEKYRSRVVNNLYVSKRLRDIGITNDYLGFYFLVDILDLMINENIQIRSFSRDVYPLLAEKYAVHEFTIERNIRNIINTLWHSRLKFKLKRVNVFDKKPRCQEFIYMLKNYVLLDLV